MSCSTGLFMTDGMSVTSSLSLLSSLAFPFAAAGRGLTLFSSLQNKKKKKFSLIYSLPLMLLSTHSLHGRSWVERNIWIYYPSAATASTLWVRRICVFICVCLCNEKKSVEQTRKHQYINNIKWTTKYSGDRYIRNEDELTRCNDQREEKC